MTTMTITRTSTKAWQVSDEAKTLLAKFPPRAVPASWPRTRHDRGAVEARLAAAPFRANESHTRSHRKVSLRAVLDWPLGSPRLRTPCAVMVNVVGSDLGDPADRLAVALRDDDVHVHLYGKTWRPGRKLGHVTALGDDVDSARRRAHTAVRALGGLAMDE